MRARWSYRPPTATSYCGFLARRSSTSSSSSSSRFWKQWCAPCTRREAMSHEGVVEGVYDLIVHGAAVLRMRMQQQGDGGIGLLRMVVAAFETALGAVDDYLRHGFRCLLPSGQVP